MNGTRGLRSVLLMAAVVAAGCSAPAPAKSLCEAYAGLTASVQQARSLDLKSASATEIEAAAQQVTSELAQVRAVAAGEIEQAASNLRSALSDFVVTLQAVNPGNRQVAAPAVQEAWNSVVSAYLSLKSPLDAQCGSA